MAEETCVLDTSVVVKWFTQESDSDKALAIRKRLQEGSLTVLVPNLLLYELANSLRWNKAFTEQDVARAIESVISGGLNILSPSLSLVHEAIRLAFLHRQTVYDSMYLAYAVHEKCVLVTADAELARADPARVKLLANQEFR